MNKNITACQKYTYVNLLKSLCLRLNSSNEQDLGILTDLLFSHGFLLS